MQDAVEAFVESWKNGTDLFEVRTSGSTGKPKTILLRREQLEASATRTLNYFRLQPGDTAVLALPIHTIAGKMMVVRSIIGQLKLIVTDPGVRPMDALLPDEKIAFFPISPMQLEQLKPEELARIRYILLGGSPLSPTLEKQITSLHSHTYIGFGMTETVSHIALRKAGSPCYEALQGVDFSTKDDKLVVNDQLLGLVDLETNDLVELKTQTSFKWLGRADFVINSGGVKIHPEQLERFLSASIDGNFFIAGIPDDTFGQKCILVSDTMTKVDDFERLCVLCKEHFGAYSAPKQWVQLPFIYSSGTKINRRLTLEQFTSGE